MQLLLLAPMHASTLELTLILLGCSVAGVVLFRLFHLPPVLGYLTVGILIGPHALGWVPNNLDARYLAEFGVVFLMFSIGLEFNLATLRSMRREVFGLGLAQVALTIAAAVVGQYWLAPWIGLGWQGALALGGALAMSSTAIVSKLLTERLEVDQPHGRLILSILLFQDLAVVLLLIVVPALDEPVERLALALVVSALKAGVVLAVLLVFGQRWMRRWFQLVAKRRSQELFTLNLLLITLGLAWLTEVAGLSMALGAFVAGVLIAETEFRHEVEEDIKPFRDVLMGLFFVTIGMLLDLNVVREHWQWVGLLLILPVLFKSLLITVLARAFGASTGDALRTGLMLAQAGEFGFVLLNQAGGLQLVGPVWQQVILASMLLSMLAAPFLIQHADAIVLRFTRADWMRRSLALTQIAAHSIATERPIILAGFGRSGQQLARVLDTEGVGYVALDLDPERVRDAASGGESVVYGDASRRESLIAAGIHRAQTLVITFRDTRSALLVLRQVQLLAPQLPVVVRTHDETDIERLRAAGATEVVPDIVEGSLMLASQALALMGVPIRRVQRRIREVREARYQLLRGYFHGADDTDDLDAAQLRLHSVALLAGSYAVGHELGDLRLAALEVEVTAMRRQGIRAADPQPDLRLKAGDVLILRGAPAALALAQDRLLAGGALQSPN